MIRFFSRKPFQMYFVYMEGRGRPVRHMAVGRREGLGAQCRWLEIQYKGGSREKNRILATENYRISDLYCNAMSKNMKQETIRIRMALPGRPALSWRRRCGTACRAGWSPATWFVSHVSLLDSHTFRSDSGNSFYFEFNYS